eukprot:jgi/Chrzof1/15074/Cz09g26080.t1
MSSGEELSSRAAREFKMPAKFALAAPSLKPVRRIRVSKDTCEPDDHHMPDTTAPHTVGKWGGKVRTHVGGYVKAVKLWCSKSFHRRDQLPQAARRSTGCSSHDTDGFKALVESRCTRDISDGNLSWPEINFSLVTDLDAVPDELASAMGVWSSPAVPLPPVAALTWVRGTPRRRMRQAVIPWTAWCWCPLNDSADKADAKQTSAPVRCCEIEPEEGQPPSLRASTCGSSDELQSAEYLTD